MKNIVTALIATEPFIPGEENGWHVEGAHRVFVAQPELDLSKVEDPAEHLETLWAVIEPHLLEVDRFVVYFGAQECAELLDRLRQAQTRSGKIVPAQAIFVLCECNLRSKSFVIAQHGFGTSTRLPSPCGIDKMTEMYASLLDEGMLAMAS